MKRRYTIPGLTGETRLTATADPDMTQVWWLDFLYVPREHRGKGYGKELMLQALEDADKERVTLILEVRCCSLPSQGGLEQGMLQAWYASLGFAIAGPGEIGPRMLREPL